MPFQQVQFGAKSASSRVLSATSERLINLYPEANPSGAKSPISLIGTPGLEVWDTVGDGPIRGLHFLEPDLYVVSGNELFIVNNTKEQTLAGEIKQTGNVRMISNNTQVGIATRNELYSANRSGIVQVSESSMNGAAYQDGFGIYTQEGGEKFFISAIDDLSTISALDFSSADAFADRVVGLISDHRELWIFGANTTEVWFNSGAAVFPFARTQGGFIERGCGASNSIAKANNSVYWVGEDMAVYAASNYQPQRISTEYIERQLATSLDVTSAVGFVYSLERRTFYVLSLVDKTLVYDTTTGVWHERVSEGETRWRANNYIAAFGLNLCGDFSNGKVYEIDQDKFTDDGDAIRREATSPPIHAAGQRISMSRFEIQLDTGIGLTTGQGSDPQLMLDWTDDGGNTYSSEVAESAGKIGDFGRRAIWSRLGQFHQRSMRVAISDPVRVGITGAVAEVETRA